MSRLFFVLLLVSTFSMSAFSTEMSKPDMNSLAFRYVGGLNVGDVGLEYVRVLGYGFAISAAPIAIVVANPRVGYTYLEDEGRYLYDTYSGKGFGLQLGGRYYFLRDDDLSGIYTQLITGVSVVNSGEASYISSRGTCFHVGPEVGFSLHTRWGFGGSILVGYRYNYYLWEDFAIETSDSTTWTLGLSIDASW